MNEDTVASMLRVAGLDQPGQPPDRVAVVTARAHGIRRRRRMTGALAVVLAVAGVVAGPALLGTGGAARPVAGATPVRDWPDRSRATDRGPAAGAVAEWSRRTGGSATDVRWLFRGTVATDGSPGTFVAVFLAPASGTDPRLVVARADRDGITDQGAAVQPADGYSPWVIHESAVPDYIGLYLGGRGEEAGNTVLVLADPTTRHLNYRLTPLVAGDSAVPPGTVGTIGARLDSTDGVFIADVGRLNGRLTVALTDTAGRPTFSGPLAPDWSAPTLAAPAEPRLPADYRDIGAITGQSALRDDGRYLSAGIDDTTAHPAGRWAVYLRCYGGGQLTVSVLDLHGVVTCDGREQHLTESKPHPAVTGYQLLLTSTTLQAYHVMVGTVG